MSTLYKESKLRKTMFTITKKEYIIILQKVFKAFVINGKARTVIHGVSIKFRRNKITTILGPNGSGKSTILKLIAGTLLPSSGNIYIEGMKLSENPESALLNIEKFINDIKIFNFLSVLEYFNLVISRHSDSDSNSLHDLLLRFIDICQIKAYLSTPLKMCSYSVVRIVKIVSTFLSNKSILLLDDPMEGLDYLSMQNICALFVDQRYHKTIIFTTCDSSVVEYLTDSVIVIIQGKKVSHTHIEHFSIEQMVYRLIFFTQQGIDYDIIINFMNKAFPTIKHEEIIGRLVYFSIPKMNVNDLWDLLNTLESSCEKLGIWKYKINPISMRHFLSYSYDNYMKKKTSQIVRYSEDSIIEEIVKEAVSVYKTQFIIFLNQRVIYYCRYPNRLLMRFVIPVLVLLIWAGVTSLSHPTVFTMDHGFFQPSYRDEISSMHQVYIGCEGTPTSCYSVFKRMRSYLYFIQNVHQIEFKKLKSDFRHFQDYLYGEGEKDFLKYTNHTLFSLYFITDLDIPVQATVMANDYKNRLFAANIADNMMMFPKVISISRIARNDFEVGTNKIDINFILRLIILLLFAYSMTTYRYVAQTNHRQFFVIHKVAGIHYSILHLPSYIIDLFLYWLVICFMILIVYLLQDHKITSIRGNVTDIISVFFLFAMADSALKLLIEHISGYSPTMIFGLTCLDLFIMLYLNVIYFVNFVIKIQKFSYGGLHLSNEKFYIVDFFFKLFFPSANLNAGLNDIELQKTTLVNGILFLQWFFYFTILCLYNSQEYKIIYYLRKFNYFGKRMITLKKKTLVNPKSFLLIKNITFLKNKKIYFSNVTAEFERGSVWGIIGNNDSGKTDLLNIILGNTIPSFGGIYLNGSLVKTLNIHEKSIKIGFCSEKLFYIPDLSVEETLIYWCRLKLISDFSLKAVISEVTNMLLLTNDMKFCAKFLSKTSIKKLDIAIAILGFPEIIILDDPLASLDSLSRLGVIKLLRKAKDHKSTVIVTGIEMSDLRNILTHVLILSDGKVHFQGRLTNAIKSSKLGYYLTIFRSLEDINVTQCEDLTNLISISFKNAILFMSYEKHMVYFLPFQDINEPNTTKILIFMETIKVAYHYQRYIIRYDVYHSPRD